MTRGHVGWIALCWLAAGAGGCAARKEEAVPEKPQATESTEAPAMATNLTCTMSVPPRLKLGEPVELRFQLTNPSAQQLYVLDWHTPFEGLLNNYLLVTRNGTELPYEGPMLKRGPPSADDYVSLAPGASAEGTVDVSLAYDFKQPGHYRIEFRGTLMDVATQKPEGTRPLDTHRSVEVRCPAVETTIVTP